MGQQPYEPSADMRMFARGMRDMFEGLTQEGFSEQQALQMLGLVIAAGMNQQNDGGA